MSFSGFRLIYNWCHCNEMNQIQLIIVQFGLYGQFLIPFFDYGRLSIKSPKLTAYQQPQREEETCKNNLVSSRAKLDNCKGVTQK